METPLKSDGATLEERAPRSLGLRVTVEEFKPEIEIGLNLEVILTQSYKIGKSENGIRSQIVNPQLIKVKELAEEKITRGRKTAEQMLRENHNLALSRSGNNFIPWGSSLSVGRNQTCELMCLQLLRRDRRSTPIGRNRSLG